MKGKTKEIKKIIYFDRETIANILQEQNKGSKQTQTEMSTSSEVSADTEAEANVKLSVPLALRLSFLFTGRIGAKFLIKRESETMITSTEISEFDIIKSALSEMKSVRVSDVENSLTSFRVAGNLMRFVKNEISRHVAESSGEIDADILYDRASRKLMDKGENARTIRNVVQRELESLLFEKVLQASIAGR